MTEKDTAVDMFQTVSKQVNSALTSAIDHQRQNGSASETFAQTLDHAKDAIEEAFNKLVNAFGGNVPNQYAQSYAQTNNAIATLEEQAL